MYLPDHDFGWPGMDLLGWKPTTGMDFAGRLYLGMDFAERSGMDLPDQMSGRLAWILLDGMPAAGMDFAGRLNLSMDFSGRVGHGLCHTKPRMC